MRGLPPHPRLRREAGRNPAGCAGRGWSLSFSAPSCWPAAWRCLSPRTGTRSAPSRASQSSSPWSPSFTWRRLCAQGLSRPLDHAPRRGHRLDGRGIALVGQIFNIQEHWPAAVLMWALAALAGWILLHDQAQQTLTLLLVPAWMLSEMRSAPTGTSAKPSILAASCLSGRFFYLTFFLGSKRKIVQGFSLRPPRHCAAIGTVLMLDGWQSWSAEQSLHSVQRPRLGVDRAGCAAAGDCGLSRA
jgi:hypothetical protein